MTTALPSLPLGRPRDLTRDAVILEATLDVLAETGYEGMTVEMVATRARAGKATLYRRWPSKAHLVVAAIASLSDSNLTLSDVPDTGSLRTDLVALKHATDNPNITLKMQILGGLVASLQSDQQLADRVKDDLIRPRSTMMRGLLARAVARGEIDPDRDLDALATLMPAMTFYRCVVLNEPVTVESQECLVEELLLPAAGVR